LHGPSLLARNPGARSFDRLFEYSATVSTVFGFLIRSMVKSSVCRRCTRNGPLSLPVLAGGLGLSRLPYTFLRSATLERVVPSAVLSPLFAVVRLDRLGRSSDEVRAERAAVVRQRRVVRRIVNVSFRYSMPQSRSRVTSVSPSFAPPILVGVIVTGAGQWFAQEASRDRRGGERTTASAAARSRRCGLRRASTSPWSAARGGRASSPHDEERSSEPWRALLRTPRRTRRQLRAHVGERGGGSFRCARTTEARSRGRTDERLRGTLVEHAAERVNVGACIDRTASICSGGT
jgi:hypothetical protein